MTIAICLKVGDGLVLGTDSASTMVTPAGQADNVYFTAEKLLNLYCGLPIGLAAYGTGGIGGRSTIHLARDLRRELADPASPRWVDPKTYTMQQVAERLKTFFFDERYAPAYGTIPDAGLMGFILAGYSAGVSSSEVWSVQMQGGTCPDPTCVFGAAVPAGLSWQGQGEALSRLIMGAAPVLHERFAGLGLAPDVVGPNLQAVAPLWHPEMPLMDAIALVKFLADVTTGYTRFAPGPKSVAPPIDVAAISLHEGFRWVDRKHYYEPVYNPPEKHKLA